MEASWNITAAYGQTDDKGNITWSQPQQITASALYAQVAIDDSGNIVIVWEDSGIKGGVLKIDNGALSFIEGPTLISTTGSATSVDFSMNGSGKAVAVWLEEDTVQMSTLQTSDKTLKWSPPSTLSQKTITISPQVAVDEKGNTLVFWFREDDQQNTFVEVISQNGNNKWSQVSDLKNEGSNIVFPNPQIAVNGGIGAAVWKISTLDSNGGVNFIIEGATAKITNDSVLWNKTVTLSDATGIPDKPQVAVGSNGRAVAIWRFVNDNNVYSIQSYDWDTTSIQTLISNVNSTGFQDVTAQGSNQGSNLAFAYWSNGLSGPSGFPTDIQFSESTLSKPVLDWSDVGKYTFATDLSSELDATIFNGTPQVIWSQNISKTSSSIQVGYPNEATPPSLVAYKLDTLNTNLAQDAEKMIASNDKAGIIVAIWLRQSQQQSPETSKMLIYWGVDDSF